LTFVRVDDGASVSACWNASRGTGKILLGNADDAEEVVAFDAFGISGEFRLNLLRGFVEAALLEQGLRLLKARIDFLRWWR